MMRIKYNWHWSCKTLKVATGRKRRTNAGSEAEGFGVSTWEKGLLAFRAAQMERTEERCKGVSCLSVFLRHNGSQDLKLTSGLMLSGRECARLAVSRWISWGNAVWSRRGRREITWMTFRDVSFSRTEFVTCRCCLWPELLIRFLFLPRLFIYFFSALSQQFLFVLFSNM